MRWLGVLALLAACDAAKTPPGQSNMPRGYDTRTSAPESQEEEEEDEEPVAPRPVPLQPAEEAAEAPATPTEPGEDEAEGEEEEPPRDLSAELQAALAGAVGCLGVRQADEGPDQLSFSATVTFTASGMATRAEVSSSTLSETERACVRQRAGATRLRAPLEDAPRTVTATVTLNRQRPP